MPGDDPQVSTSPKSETPAVKPKRPYQIVFAGDLRSGGRLKGLTPVDKNSFAEVLAAARPSAAIALPNPLGGGGEWEFVLSFDSLKAFDPRGMLGQVPGGRWRLGVREKLIARRRNEINEDALMTAAQAASTGDASLAWLPGALTAAGPAAEAAPPAAAGGGSILDMVDAPDETARVAADVARLAADAGDPQARLSGATAARIENALARVDRELNAIANGLLKHPDVRAIETAWRSVKLIVDRLDFRENVRFGLVDAPRAECVEVLTAAVFDPAFNGDIATPGLIVCDHAVASTPADVEFLDALAQQAASLPVPVVVPCTAGLLNVKNLRLVRNLPNLPGLIGGWEFAKWRTLRDQPYARWLAPVLGRFILRAPWKPEGTPADFVPTETIEKSEDIVWAGGHVAMAICAGRSHARHGWPTRMFGAEAGKIEDLVVVPNPNDPQNPWGPGDLLLPDRRLDELPAIGVNFVMAVKDSDHCMLLGGVSLARPIATQETGQQQATLQISLPYQQFSSIASAYVCELMPELRGLSEQQIKEKVIFSLAGLVGIQSADEMEAVQVAAGPNPQVPGQTIVQIRLEPPARIVPGGLKVEFGFSV